MSAPLSINADGLQSLAFFLARISNATKEHGVDLTPYGPITVSLGPGAEHIQITWRSDIEEYVVDDRIGS